MPKATQPAVSAGDETDPAVCASWNDYLKELLQEQKLYQDTARLLLNLERARLKTRPFLFLPPQIARLEAIVRQIDRLVELQDIIDDTRVMIDTFCPPPKAA